MNVRDALGVEVEVGDLVVALHYGYNVGVGDCGRRFTVTGFTRAGNLVHGTDDFYGRAVKPEQVAVARRDGTPGHEGNRQVTA